MKATGKTRTIQGSKHSGGARLSAYVDSRWSPVARTRGPTGRKLLAVESRLLYGAPIEMYGPARLGHGRSRG